MAMTKTMNSGMKTKTSFNIPRFTSITSEFKEESRQAGLFSMIRAGWQPALCNIDTTILRPQPPDLAN
jgi:hypothetical protein